MSSEAATSEFMRRVEINETSGCWVWRGSKHQGGYGVFYFDRSRHFAHRWAYERFVGPIPPGLTIDHCCHNTDQECAGGVECPHRLCVNPDHLEPIPNAANVLRGKSTSAQRARQTHCKRGHLLAGDNVRLSRRGHRRCKTCEVVNRQENREAYAAASRRWYARKKLEQERAAA